VFEQTEDGWKHLLKVWISAHLTETVASGLSFFSTEFGHTLLGSGLQKCYRSINVPLVVAVDTNTQEVIYIIYPFM